MTALLNSLFSALTPLWEMSLTAAYVTAVVILLRLVLKKRAPKQILCLLWLVVFARLLVPVNLESPFSILPDEERVQAVQSLPSRLAGVEPSPVLAQNPDSAPVQTPGVTAGQTVPDADAVSVFPILSVPDGVTLNAQSQAPAGFPWQALLAGVWLAGAAAMCLYALTSYLSLKSRLYDAIRAEDGAWEHPSISSPFILGVFRPRIYLPAGLWGMPRKFILCHERAHLRRLDHIIKPICWMALALHWFNPAAWLAFILMSRDIEAACDEAVIRRLGPRVKADYSATLLSLATNGRVPAPCPLAFDEGDAKGRIQNVLRYRRPALWIVVVSVIMAVMAAVCLLTDPVSAQSDPDPSASESQSAGGTGGLLDPWMEEILAGRQNFTSADTGENVNIDLLNGAYPPDAPFNSITLSQFAVVDLNRDGIHELVLSPSIDGDGTLERISTLGYLILHRQGDEVSSYNLGYRAFGSLKADGTFWFSSSASDSGYAHLRFADGSCVTDEVTYSRSTYDEAGGEMRVSYFVDGLAAEQAEYNAAIDAWNAQPGVAWYTYADGQLLEADQLSSVPANADDLGLSIPDFLDNEQQILYCNALITYSHLFGTSSELVNPNSYGTTEPVEYNGRYYYPDTGVYGSWEEFEGTVLSTFTENFWNTRNKDQLYVNINGIMHYLDWARGGGGYNENFPETFRLVERTDDAISFIMTGYYSDSRPFYGTVSDEKIEAWLAAGWESSIEFPMRMVKTENGWRFDEFHNARTDNSLLEFSSQAVPNPNAPVMDNIQEPEPTPFAAPTTVCTHGLEDAAFKSMDGLWELYCMVDHFAYTRISLDYYYSTYEHWDLDNDGNMEMIAYTKDGQIVVFDVENGQFNTYNFDPTSVIRAFRDNCSVEIIDNNQTFRLTYEGQTILVAAEPDFFLNHDSGTSEPGVYQDQTTYALGSDSLFRLSSPVDLSSYGAADTPNIHWSIRYSRGGTFDVVPGSFQFE